MEEKNKVANNNKEGDEERMQSSVVSPKERQLIRLIDIQHITTPRKQASPRRRGPPEDDKEMIFYFKGSPKKHSEQN